MDCGPRAGLFSTSDHVSICSRYQVSNGHRHVAARNRSGRCNFVPAALIAAALAVAGLIGALLALVARGRARQRRVAASRALRALERGRVRELAGRTSLAVRRGARAARVEEGAGRALGARRLSSPLIEIALGACLAGRYRVGALLVGEFARLARHARARAHATLGVRVEASGALGARSRARGIRKLTGKAERAGCGADRC